MDSARLTDPRYFQIGVLSLLLSYGLLVLDFGIRLQNAAAIFACAQVIQYLLSHRAGIRFDPLSALITSLSLTLLRPASPSAASFLSASAANMSSILRTWHWSS